MLGYDWNSLKKFIRISSLSKKINKAFKKEIKENWPGAFTAVLPKSKKVPHFLNKGFKTIGIRVPNNKFLLSVLKECPNRVLASTSANISGKSHLKPQKELLKKVKLFIKAKKGELLLKPSKIIEFKKNKIVILRKG